MSNSTPELSSPSQTKFIFPKLSLLKQNSKLKTVKIYSNHFDLELPKNLQFNEWFIRMIDKEDVSKFREDPSQVEEAVELDARKLINEIYYTNKDDLNKAIGFTIITG